MRMAYKYQAKPRINNLTNSKIFDTEEEAVKYLQMMCCDKSDPEMPLMRKEDFYLVGKLTGIKVLIK